MNEVKQWILIDPLDTLFFKGSEAMIAGESHEVRSVFPPMPSTLRGALCTAIIQQRGISLTDFVASVGPDPAILAKYTFLGTPGNPEFDVTGPLFLVNLRNTSKEWLFPTPAHWFGELPGELEDGQEVRITVTDVLPESLRPPGLCGNVSNPVWVLSPESQDMKSLAGYWTNAAALNHLKEGKGAVRLYTSLKAVSSDEPALVNSGSLFESEIRVGIALEGKTRKVRTGHLYSTSQVRIRAGVYMAVGLSQGLVPTHLDAEGIIQLGGEQRIVRYQGLGGGPSLNPNTSPWAMALSPIPYSELRDRNWEEMPRVSGPIIRMGGWDMKEGFHKLMTAYLPSGTVIRVGQEGQVPFGLIRI